MSLTYVGLSSAASGSGATITLSQDITGLADGDLMTMVIYSNANPLDPATPPAGWTLRGQSIVGSPAVFVWTKTADNEPASYTIARGASSKTYIARIIAHRSDSGATIVVDDCVGAELVSVDFTWHYPSVTTAHDNGALLCFGNMGTNRSQVPPGDMTERWDELLATMRVYAMTALVATAGATGTKACQDPTGAINNGGNGVSIALSELPLGLDASLTTFLQVQAARQTDFDSPATPTTALPLRFEYADGDQDQVAAWDSGAWTGLEIVERVAQIATVKLRGALFFELMPLLLAAGFAAMDPSGDGPYAYEDSVAPGATGTPSPYTFLLGGNDGNRSPTSLVQVQDAYLSKLTLTYSPTVHIVQMESEWFGRYIDDNSGLGFEPAAVSLPDGLRMVNGLLSTLGLQDAGDTGGAFDAITEFECELVEWTLTLDTGLRPAWCGDGNNLSYGGVRQEWPALSFAPTIRTNLDTYALVLTKAQQRQAQELQLTFYGEDRSLVLRMTGRWQPKLNAHERVRGEVVMKPTFEARTPYSQATSPHWLSYEMLTGWEH